MNNWQKVTNVAARILLYGLFALLVFALLTPSSHVGRAARRNKARIEMSALLQAIESYHAVYGHMPVSPAVLHAAQSGSFTYGALIPSPKLPSPIGTLVGGQVVLNSELIAVLMDVTNYPGNPGQATINTNHWLNPQQTKFLNANLVSETSSSGVGPDLVYRDPWGTPYVITLNLSEANQCQDVFYGRPVLPPTTHTQVMVWSAGPDKKINTSAPRGLAENKDNVVSWQ